MLQIIDIKNEKEKNLRIIQAITDFRTKLHVQELIREKAWTFLLKIQKNKSIEKMPHRKYWNLGNFHQFLIIDRKARLIKSQTIFYGCFCALTKSFQFICPKIEKKKVLSWHLKKILKIFGPQIFNCGYLSIKTLKTYKYLKICFPMCQNASLIKFRTIFFTCFIFGTFFLSERHIFQKKHMADLGNFISLIICGFTKSFSKSCKTIQILPKRNFEVMIMN